VRIRLLVFVLLVPCTGCRPNHSITPEPTVEEPPRLAAVINVIDPKMAPQLIRGFYPVEEGSWRWTKGKFAVSLARPPGAGRNGAWVILKFQLPGVLLQKLKSVTVSAELDHTPLAPETFDQAGPQEYRREVPAHLLQKESVLVEFSLDRYLPAGMIESRELGLSVSSIALESR
jgi:hypothetical protein